MDIKRLYNWISKVVKYTDYIEGFCIANTRLSLRKPHPNFTYTVIWSKLSDDYAEAYEMMFLQTEIKVECCDYRDSAIYMLQIINLIKSYKIPYIEYNIKFIRDKVTEYDLEKFIRGYDDSIAYQALYKYEKELNDKYKEKYSPVNERTILRYLDMIYRRLKSNKESYIVSKLIGGGLKKSDIRKYPELIEVADELQKLRTIFN